MTETCILNILMTKIVMTEILSTLFALQIKFQWHKVARRGSWEIPLMESLGTYHKAIFLKVENVGNSFMNIIYWKLIPIHVGVSSKMDRKRM